MKKEDVLEMSRSENKKRDMYEIEVETRACKIAVLCMLVLITVYYCYEIFIGKGQNYTLYSLISLYCAVVYGYKAIKLEKRKGLYIFCSITWAFMTIAIILEYFKVI